VLAGTLAAALALAAAGCSGTDSGSGGSAPRISVSSAYMPQPVSDSLAAGFLTIVNEGGTADRLTSAHSDVGEVTVHETVGQAMRPVDRLTVPAGGRLVLESGGNHLMFEQLTRKPRQGETVTVELRFAESGTVTVKMPVKPATYSPKTAH
jgi:copper(I)-binding protein